MELCLLVWLAGTLLGSSITSAQSDQYSKAVVSVEEYPCLTLILVNSLEPVQNFYEKIFR